VAVDLFAAGLSAGAFIISATAYFLGRERYETITRIGAYIAPFPVIIGIFALIYDLERPHLFWKLFLQFSDVARILAPFIFLPLQCCTPLPLASGAI
jgi:formate-dependent nitrite reductase membrane component NrfD